ncbi:MAG: signal peptidase II [Chloroflexi bacterium]|nr:signal peptidase II [Chloroflexota bacterium]
MEDIQTHTETQRPGGILGLLPLLVLIAILAADQVSKWLVTLTLGPGESVPESGFFRFTYVTNSGSAFGLFPNQTLFLVLASFVGIVILLVFYRTHSVSSAPIQISLGLQLGGAIGNLIDRIRVGYVVDFLDVGAWPVFNIADSAIVVGLAGLVWTIILSKSGATATEKVTSGGAVPDLIIDGEEALPDPEREKAAVADGSNPDREDSPWEKSES